MSYYRLVTLHVDKETCEKRPEMGFRSNETGFKYIRAHNQMSVWFGVGLQL